MAEQGIYRRRVIASPKTRRRPWPALAEVLAAEIPRGSLEAAAVNRLDAAPRNERVAIACSGGADSVALVLLLRAHFPKRRGRWLILHFDHRLRGRDSTNDARFVERLAAALGEVCVIGRWVDRPDDPATVSEAAARSARQAFFATAMSENNAHILALGHHADDVAETLFMRLAHGSGVSGLCAPRPVHEHADAIVRVRPLLSLESEFIREKLVGCGIPWREDASNREGDFFRNRIRNHVIPAWRQASEQDAIAGIGRTRKLLEEDATALDAWLDELITLTAVNAPLDLAPLAGKPRALFRRALIRWLAMTGVNESLSRSAVDHLVDCLHAGRAATISAGTDRWVRFAGGKLSIARREPCEPIEPGTIWAWNETAQAWVGPDNNTVTFKNRRMTRSLYQHIVSGKPSPAREAFVDAGKLDIRSLIVRTRLPGDRYQPLGSPGRRKLQDMLVDAKVPGKLRSRLPLVCGREAIFWVPGFPPAQGVAIGENTKHVVQLTYS